MKRLLLCYTVICYCFRLDRYRGDPKEDHKDCFDFECHILMDDAFMTDDDTNKRLVNSYVNDLIQVVIEVYRWDNPTVKYMCIHLHVSLSPSFKLIIYTSFRSGSSPTKSLTMCRSLRLPTVAGWCLFCQKGTCSMFT